MRCNDVMTVEACRLTHITPQSWLFLLCARIRRPFVLWSGKKWYNVKLPVTIFIIIVFDCHASGCEQLRSLRVVAVDDDALVLMNTIAMLEDLGHTAFEAFSGKQALEILQREDSIDLIITDQAMSHMTGTQLVKAIKQEWPDVCVLLATGYAEIKSEDDTGLPKLSKPFLEGELAAALARLYPTPRQDGDRVVPLRTRSGPPA